MARLITSFFSGYDPAWNLALEEVIFDTLDEDSLVLLFYINDRCVVVGKHQNPWREIDLACASAETIPVHRRLTGGGTVFHDRGNLVFSFLGRRDVIDRTRDLEIVRDALELFGVDAEISGTWDLYAEGAKLSGNAFCFRRNRALHHGTILIDADRNLMNRLLSPGPLPIETHAVASRPAHTTTLRELGATVTASAIAESIVSKACSRSGIEASERLRQESFDLDRVAELAERNRSWVWNFGRTPLFSVVCTDPTPSDEQVSVTRFRLRVKHGTVEAAELVDADEVRVLHEVISPLVGSRYVQRELVERISPDHLPVRRAIESTVPV